ncbi:MAG: hypothetical protein FWF69_08790 [Firmicutes bacterium]|nr:hypothetical protein [Bacillota bacterium]
MNEKAFPGMKGSNTGTITVPVNTAVAYAMKSQSPNGRAAKRFSKNKAPNTIMEMFAADIISIGVRTNLSHIVNCTVRISFVALYAG